MGKKEREALRARAEAAEGELVRARHAHKRELKRKQMVCIAGPRTYSRRTGSGRVDHLLPMAPTSHGAPFSRAQRSTPTWPRSAKDRYIDFTNRSLSRTGSTRRRAARQ